MLKYCSSILRWYNKKLETHPVITKCITSGIIAGSGDICCQYATYNPYTNNNNTSTNTTATSVNGNNNSINNDKIIKIENNNVITSLMQTTDDHNNTKFQLDTKRTFNFTILGFLLVGPILHVWYGLLARHVTSSSLLLTSIKRTILDQTICAPLFLPTFMISLMILEGKSVFNEIDRNYMKLKLYNDYFDLLFMNWSLWIPAQIVNFRVIPPNYTLLFSNCIGFIWNIYLSYKSNSKVDATSSTQSSSPSSAANAEVQVMKKA